MDSSKYFKDYVHQLHFVNRFHGFEAMIAFATKTELRVAGYSNERWQMLHRRGPSNNREIHAIKWHPSNGHLAVSSGALNGRKGMIAILEHQTDGFVKIRKLEVDGHVTSLAWKKNILVGTVLSTIPKMVIFRALSGTRYSFKKIQCPYEKFFTTEIHPNGNTILTATAASKQISFWVEDKISFEWKVAVEISCLYGINNMCFNQDGDKIAILAGKHLRLFYYDDDSSDGGPFQPRLEKMDLEDDDGKDRFSTCSLKRHCDSSISVNWSRTDELLTGSSLGTMCIHMQCLDGTGSYVVKYFRYKDLHSCNISGLVTCVAWNPLEPTMLASAGVDGFVILWKLLDPSVALTYIRSYALEARYFLPQRPRYLSMNEDAIRDVASVSSVDTTMSSTFNSDSDLDSDSSNDGQGGVKGNPVEAALQEISLRQKKVAKSLKVLVETLKKVKERAGGPKDLINQILKSVDQISSDQADIRDLMNSHKDNIEKAISDIQDQVSDVEQTFKEELQDLKGKMAVESTNLSSDVLAAIRQVKQSNDALEGKILSRQTQFEDSLLERHRKMEESALLRLGQFEEMVLTKMKSQEDTIVQKQGASERSVMTRLTQLDKTTVSVTSSLESSFQLKHSQLLETTEPRYKLMEEKLDQLNGLCEKMFKLLSK